MSTYSDPSDPLGAPQLPQKNTDTKNTDDMSNADNDIREVRKAGKVLIRGMFRRVWRPRYLEIRNDGSVRYYEPCDLDRFKRRIIHKVDHQDYNEQHQKESIARYHEISFDEIKSATSLSIPLHQSDEIDTSIFRDPFPSPEKSQQSSKSSTTSCDAPNSDTWDVLCAPNNAILNKKYLRLKATMVVHDARTIDATHRDAHIGLPRNVFGFLFHSNSTTSSNFTSHNSSHLLNRSHHSNQNLQMGDNAQQKNQKTSFPSLPEKYTDALKHLNTPPSRDYMCAVSTEEEAREWLQALQWAASIKLQHQQKEKQEQEEHLVLEDYCTPSYNKSSGNSVTSSQRSISSLISNHSEERTNQVRRRKRSETKKHSGNDPNSHKQQQYHQPKIKNKNEGRVVVTKVRKFAMQIFPFQMKYEIRMILIESGKSNGKGKNVEERSFFHSHADFSTLLKKLKEEYNSPPPTNSNRPGSKITGTLSMSPSKSTALNILQKAEMDLRKNMNDWSHIRNGATFDRAASEEVLLQNIDTLDKVLRLLTSDATTCNSKSMREFLFLKNNKKNIANMKHVTKKFTSSAADESTDDFVKKWLWQDSTDTISMSMWTKYFVMQLCLRFKKLIFMAIVFLMLLFGVDVTPEERFLSSHISMRIDVLISVIALAFSLGREISRLNMKAQVLNTTSESSRDAFQTYIKNSSVLEKFMRLLQTKGLTHPTKDRDDITESDSTGKGAKDHEEDDDDDESITHTVLRSPLPVWPSNGGISCWSEPRPDIFKIRGKSYLQDKVKVKSKQSMFQCRGVDLWLSKEPMKHIARHPSVLGGKLQGSEDTLIINFLLPFGNFVGYFTIPDVNTLPDHLANVWTKFRSGSKEYRDARLKLLPVVVDGPWIVRKAVGPGSAPAVLGKVIPLLYYTGENIFEVDVNITSSRVAKAILNVVKGHTDVLTIAFAFIIEAVTESELPECVLCSFQIHEINIGRCPTLPAFS